MREDRIKQLTKATVTKTTKSGKDIIISVLEENETKRLKATFRKLHIDNDGTVTLGERVNL